MARWQVMAGCAACLLVLGTGTVAKAEQTIDEAGVIVCINDKWDEKEVEKGHKLVDYAGRCVDVPDDSTQEKYTEDCTGKYEYMPDGSWTGSGSCKITFKGGDTMNPPGRKAQRSRNIPTTIPTAPANMRARPAAAPISTRI